MTSARAKTVERGMITGIGVTTTEAKADLNSKIDVALKGSYEPTVATHGRYMAVMYRSPQGWSYRLIDRGGLPESGFSDSGCEHFEGSRDTCFQSMAFHLLDVGSTPDEFRTNNDIPSWIADPDKRQTLLSNARFRRAYRWAKENHVDGDGLDNDHSIHAWACNHERDAQFA